VRVAQGCVVRVPVRVRSPFIELVDRSGFALPGESLFSVARMAGPKKGTKNACPVVRPCAARRVPSLHRRSKGPWLGAPRQKGHPWPSTPCAASLRLTPLRDDSAQPDERGVWRRLQCRAAQGASLLVGWITAKPYPPDGLPVLLRGSGPLAAKLPLRPAERRRCAGGERPGWPREAGLGQGWPMPAGPRSGAGARGVWPRSGQTRMSGCPFSLVTFLLGKQQESDSAEGPKPVPARHAGNEPYTKSPGHASYGPRWASRRSAPTYAEGAHRSGRKAPGVGGTRS
jgi:hypothetical protein